MGMTLLQIDTRVTSGNSASVLRISIAVSDNIRLLNSCPAARTADVNSSGSTIMNVAFLNRHMATINVDNTPSRRRRNIHAVQNCSRCWQYHHGLVVGTHGRLNLNGRVSIPYVDAMADVAQIQVFKDAATLSDTDNGLVVSASSQHQLRSVGASVTSSRTGQRRRGFLKVGKHFFLRLFDIDVAARQNPPEPRRTLAALRRFQLVWSFLNG
mmetsp:Transcript_89729/g.134484  ORF Transcript_89729/g.134484 Transcript_89729/m.134484 type:complete len:212 (-) Transcript_89729:17-652(-)